MTGASTAVSATASAAASPPRSILLLTLFYLCLLPAGATVALVMLGNTAPVPMWLAVVLAPWSAFLTIVLTGRFARVHPRPLMALVLLLDGPLFGLLAVLAGGDFDPWRLLLYDALVEGVAVTAAAAMEAERTFGTRLRDRLMVVLLWGSVPLFPLYVSWPILRDALQHAPVEGAFLLAGAVWSCLGYLRLFRAVGMDRAVTSRRESLAMAPVITGLLVWLWAIAARQSLPGWFG